MNPPNHKSARTESWLHDMVPKLLIVGVVALIGEVILSWHQRAVLAEKALTIETNVVQMNTNISKHLEDYNRLVISHTTLSTAHDKDIRAIRDMIQAHQDTMKGELIKLDKRLERIDAKLGG